MTSQGLSIYTLSGSWVKPCDMKQDSAKAWAETRTVPLWARVAIAAPLVTVAAFTAFGFLATFEPNPWWITWPWRVAYLALGLGSLAGVLKLLIKRRAKPSNSTPKKTGC